MGLSILLLHLLTTRRNHRRTHRLKKRLHARTGTVKESAKQRRVVVGRRRTVHGSVAQLHPEKSARKRRKKINARGKAANGLMIKRSALDDGIKKTVKNASLFF